MSIHVHAHSFFPHIGEARGPHLPILLLDIALHTGSDGILLTCEGISQFLERNPRLAADQILIDGIILEEIVCGIEGTSFQGRGMVVA